MRVPDNGLHRARARRLTAGVRASPCLTPLSTLSSDCLTVGVVSDTHLPRFGRGLPAALCRGLRGVGLILHLGDFTGPDIPQLFESLAPLEAVSGNNDPPVIEERFGRRKIVQIAGARLGLVHGDGSRGTTVARSLAAFAQDEVDAVCFGHSHQPLCERRGSVWLVNPGSPTDKRRQPRYSYALLDIERGSVRPRLVFFDDRELD